MTHQSATPPRSAFPWYLTSSSAWLGGMSLQGFLLTWLLVGVLDTPADRVGFGRALIDLPALAILLLGGILADRTEGRLLLLRLHLLIAVPPLVLAALVMQDLLSFWVVVLFGLAMAALQSTSDPARQSILNRVTRIDIQRTVTIMTIVTSFVGLGAVWLGGQLERIGIPQVLAIQALFFASGALAMRQLPALPVRQSPGPPDLLGGLKGSWRVPLVRDIIGLNFASSLFNAGAYIVAVPFIVRVVYEGGAEFFATVMIVFTVGSIGSNIVLLRFMPLLRPGRLFLLMQLTRIVILALLMIQPALWLFLVLMLAWGFNMGITSTLVRTTVQELAPETSRAQILSLLTLSFMVASPISSLLLGKLIAVTDPLTALMPGVVISAMLFIAGAALTGLWGFHSPSAVRYVRRPAAPSGDGGALS
jgi:predicted MFS family arabinose efflux permease